MPQPIIHTAWAGRLEAGRLEIGGTAGRRRGKKQYRGTMQQETRSRYSIRAWTPNICFMVILPMGPLGVLEIQTVLLICVSCVCDLSFVLFSASVFVQLGPPMGPWAHGVGVGVWEHVWALNLRGAGQQELR